MKRFLKFLCSVLAAALLLGLCSCEEKFEYTMKGHTTGALYYEIPEHFEIAPHEEADAYYLTLNSSVLAYSYTLSEFDLIFVDYVGDYSATSVAEFLVERNEYNCLVNEGAAPGSAIYSYMYSDEYNNTYYSSSVVLADEENICVFVFSCIADKLSVYQEMLLEMLGSLRIEE